MKISEEEVKGGRWAAGRGGRGSRPWMKEVSARSLAASLWQLAATNSNGDHVKWRCGLSDRLGFEFCSPSVPIPKFEMEGLTKWDRINTTKPAAAHINNFRGQVILLHQDQENVETVSSSASKISFKPPKSTKQPKPEKGFWSKTRLLKYCMRKLEKEEEEEGTSWMITEVLQQMFAIIKLLKDKLKRESKKRQQMYVINTKLLRDFSEAKSFALRFMHDYGKEKKARELLQDVCNEQGEKIKAHEEEIRQLRIERERIREEVEEEREMLQIAESWREERAQMKLLDAKSMLEDKFCEMNSVISDLKVFLGSSNFGGNIADHVLHKIINLKSDEDDHIVEQDNDDVVEGHQESNKVDNSGEISSVSMINQSKVARLVSGFGESSCFVKKARAVRSQPRWERKAVGIWVGRTDPNTDQITSLPSGSKNK